VLAHGEQLRSDLALTPVAPDVFLAGRDKAMVRLAPGTVEKEVELSG
jgi:hypothetical protein